MGLAWPAATGVSTDDAEAPPSAEYSADEEAMVAERLRALGYLD
jgi:hypothetical protein